MLVRTRSLSPAFDRFDRAFDQLTNTFLSTTRRTPVVDAAWRDGSLVLTVDLPGTPADSVDVSVAGRTLTLSATSDELTWERSIRLGTALDPEQVSASYADGRLTVTVGAVASAQPRRIEIATKPAIEPAAGDATADQADTGTSDSA